MNMMCPENREGSILQVYETRCSAMSGDAREEVKLYNLEVEDKETKVKVEVDLKLFQMECN